MITLPLPYPIVNRFSQNTCEHSMKKVQFTRAIRKIASSMLSAASQLIFAHKKVRVNCNIKSQPHREGFVPDTAVLISVYYVRSDSAAPAQIMATPAFDCGVCSDT